MKSPDDPFLGQAGRILNSGQARTLLITGNVHDLFHRPTIEGEDDDLGRHVPLIDFLRHHWRVAGKILLVYELNGPIRFADEADRGRLRDAWMAWRTGVDPEQLAIDAMLSSGKGPAGARMALGETFDNNLKSAIGNPTVAFELLRQLCVCSRFQLAGKEVLEDDLLILVEAADLALPEGTVTSLSDADRRRLAICQDWFSDPGFMEARDAVVLVSESRSLINQRIARLPQILDVEIPAPDLEHRRHFITWFNRRSGKELRLWGSQRELAEMTAGLSLHALRQLLEGAIHRRETLQRHEVVARVEAFVQSQLGDVVELEKPEHRLTDVVGFRRLKGFFDRELLPRLRKGGKGALPGAAVAGPIGSGKTFVFQAVAAELDMVVLVLKNLRSQWFGQTDVIFERLRRVLEALSKAVIFVDEADTQFGGVGPEAHATERRLTGKIQAMMSDPRLRGRVIWLLMTARIHLLSPDIRRPGRVGELIIPVLDPEGDDRRDFLRWTLRAGLDADPSEADLDAVDQATVGYSPAAFAALRSRLKSEAEDESLSAERVIEIVHDLLPPDIGETRRYQTLQALINCTRRSLLPDPKVSDDDRGAWRDEIRVLESRGIR